MILRNGLGVEPYAPITNLDTKTILPLQEADPYSLALAVLAGIRQGFLGNPVDGIFQGRVQPIKLNSVMQIDLRPFSRPQFMDKVGDGFHDT